jgi:hypothetical protein
MFSIVDHYSENQSYILEIPPYSFVAQGHLMNTAPRCGALQYQTNAKVSNNRQHSYETKRCNQS